MSKSTISVPAVILEYKTGKYEGNDFASVLCRVGDRIVKFKVDLKTCPDLSSMTDKKVSLSVDIVAGVNLAATPKVVGIEGK